MKRIFSLQAVPMTAIVILVTILISVTAGTVVAQDRSVQPALRLVVGRVDEGLTDAEAEARRLLFAAVEARFASQQRYRLSRDATDLAPDAYVAENDLRGIDVALFLRLGTRLDGSARVEFDLYDDGAFVQSGEDELPVGDRRFSAVDALANELTDAVAARFPGFGRLRFTNTGYPHNYYVRIDGADFGANIDEIDLPVGSYTIEIRRRDGSFSQTVGERRVDLAADDFYELVFAMDRTAPSIPRFRRLTDPSDRWNVIWTIRGSGLVPVQGLEELSMQEGWSTSASALFGGIPFEGALVGFEASHLRYVGTLTEEVEETSGFQFDLDARVDVWMTPVLANVGLTVGPVSGVDLVIRGGGGAAIYRIRERTEGPGDFRETSYNSEIDPAFNGTVEFGFGIGRYGRISVQTALFGVVTDDDTVLWAQFGVGVGARF